MQYITTKHFGPGNRIGSRIKATASAGHKAKFLSYHQSWSAEANHHEAAKALATSLRWEGTWICGEGAKGEHVWVWISRHDARATRYPARPIRSLLLPDMAQCERCYLPEAGDFTVRGDLLVCASCAEIIDNARKQEEPEED